MTSKKCEMVFAHHPDCTCAHCWQNEDEQCQNLAWGYVPEQCGVRVCRECAKGMEQEDFKVVRL